MNLLTNSRVMSKIAHELYQEARILGLDHLAKRVFAWLFMNSQYGNFSISIGVEADNLPVYDGRRCTLKDLEYGYFHHYVVIDGKAWMPMEYIARQAAIYDVIDWSGGKVIGLENIYPKRTMQVGKLWTEEYYAFFMADESASKLFGDGDKDNAWLEPKLIEVSQERELHYPKHIQNLGRGILYNDENGNHLYRQRHFSVGADYRFLGGYDPTCNRHTFFKRNYPEIINGASMYWYNDGTIGMIDLPYSDEAVLGIRPSNIKDYYATVQSFFDDKDINTYEDEYMNIVTYKDCKWVPQFK